MTDRDKRDDESEALLSRGFAERGELLPTTEAEVERAETELGDDVEIGALPDQLAGDWRDAPRATARISPAASRGMSVAHRPWLAYAGAGAIGALAASLAFLWLGRTPSRHDPLISGASNEFRRPPTAPAVSSKVHVAAPPRCGNDCCAGSDCPSARDDLKACSSGRRCIACPGDAHVDGGYRLRVGNLALTDDGKRLRDENTWTDSLELCVRAGSSAVACAPTQPQGTTVAPWTILPDVVSPQNLLAGFELTVREHGKTDVIATWSTPVVVNADVLCRGIAAKPRLPSGATFAVVSVFLEDAYYVELARSSAVTPLTALRSHLDVTDLTPSLYETTAAADRRFALVLGPMSQSRAEDIRWQVLGAGRDAKVSLGGDFTGEAKPLP